MKNVCFVVGLWCIMGRFPQQASRLHTPQLGWIPPAVSRPQGAASPFTGKTWYIHISFTLESILEFLILCNLKSDWLIVSLSESGGQEKQEAHWLWQRSPPPGNPAGFWNQEWPQDGEGQSWVFQMPLSFIKNWQELHICLHKDKAEVIYEKYNKEIN